MVVPGEEHKGPPRCPNCGHLITGPARNYTPPCDNLACVKVRQKLSELQQFVRRIVWPSTIGGDKWFNEAEKLLEADDE